MKRKSKKTLCINIENEINETVMNYALASGVNLQDVGFSIGRICKDEDLTYQLSFLMSIYFKAGIYYAKEGKDPRFWYKYLTASEVEKMKERLEKQQEDILEDIKSENKTEKGKASYIG